MAKLTIIAAKDHPLRGLQKVCKRHGKMKCGTTVMVWDYAQERAVRETEMRAGSERWLRSEKARTQTP